MLAHNEDRVAGDLGRKTNVRLLVEGKMGPKEIGKLIKFLRPRKPSLKMTMTTKRPPTEAASQLQMRSPHLHSISRTVLPATGSRKLRTSWGTSEQDGQRRCHSAILVCVGC